jgi:hypothetical protein
MRDMRHLNFSHLAQLMATICPSEVAFAIAPGERWRDMMSAVHAAIDHQCAEGTERLSWKGKSLVTRSGLGRPGTGEADCCVSGGSGHIGGRAARPRPNVQERLTLALAGINGFPPALL